MNLKTILVLLFLGVSAPLLANKTPSDVFQVTQQIVLEVQHLRSQSGATDTPRIPDVQVYKTPLHVFAKSLEVLSKVASIQQENGLSSLPEKNIPLKKITLSDVFQQAEIILQQIRTIQRAQNIGAAQDVAPLIGGKTPSNVYENLWKISFMLDALVQRITPTDVYNNAQKANAEIRDVAVHLNVNVSSQLPETDTKTKPSQVLLQGYINLHNISALEKKLGLKPFRVPSYPKGKITPSDVYDSVSMLVAEVSRIKIHLKLKNDSAAIIKAKKKKPSDVLAAMLMAEKNINALTHAQ